MTVTLSLPKDAQVLSTTSQNYVNKPMKKNTFLSGSDFIFWQLLEMET